MAPFSVFCQGQSNEYRFERVAVGCKTQPLTFMPVVGAALLIGKEIMGNEQVSEIQLRPWAEGDLWLEEKLMGDPALTVYLGGPETPEKIRERHQRYCKMTGSDKGEIFVIEVGPERRAAGSVGYWETEWQGIEPWETGWSVLQEFQGQGLAARAILLMAEKVWKVGKYRSIHAFPRVDNAPSNAVCRKAGFLFVGEFDFEYPKGNPIRCNDWRLDQAGK